MKNFFRYKSTGVKVWVDDRLVYNNLLLSAAIGICKFNGGGIQQLPAAVADDGMLDLSLIRPVHFWHLLFRFHYLFLTAASTASATSSRSAEAASASNLRPRFRSRSTESRWPYAASNSRFSTRRSVSSWAGSSTTGGGAASVRARKVAAAAGICAGKRRAASGRVGRRFREEAGK